MTQQTVGELMTRDVVRLPEDASLVDAAQAMRDRQIGDVLVTDNGAVVGLATDRDIVIRAIAAGMDPSNTRLSEVVSGDVVAVREDAPTEEAVELMRQRKVRRLVVTDDSGRLAGIVSIGDLAVAKDPNSALGTISEAPPNR